jgi:hypothetical protein
VPPPEGLSRRWVKRASLLARLHPLWRSSLQGARQLDVLNFDGLHRVAPLPFRTSYFTSGLHPPCISDGVTDIPIVHSFHLRASWRTSQFPSCRSFLPLRPFPPRPRRLPRCGRIPGTRKVSEDSERSPLGNGGRPWQGMSPTPTNLRASDCPAPSSCVWHKGCLAQWRGRIKEKEWGEKYFIGTWVKRTAFIPF